MHASSSSEWRFAGNRLQYVLAVVHNAIKTYPRLLYITSLWVEADVTPVCLSVTLSICLWVCVCVSRVQIWPHRWTSLWRSRWRLSPTASAMADFESRTVTICRPSRAKWSAVAARRAAVLTTTDWRPHARHWHWHRQMYIVSSLETARQFSS